MAIVETKWSLTVDTHMCEARFVVEYHSTLPPERHEEIHEQILKQANEMIQRMWGNRPEWQRYDVVVLCKPMPVPVPPLPQPNPERGNV